MKLVVTAIVMMLISIGSGQANWFVYSDENNIPRVFGIAVHSDQTYTALQLFCDQGGGLLSLTVETSQNFASEDSYPRALMGISYNNSFIEQDGKTEFMVDVFPVRTPSGILAYRAELNLEKTLLLKQGLLKLKKIAINISGHNIDEPQMVQSEEVNIYSDGVIGTIEYLEKYCGMDAS